MNKDFYYDLPGCICALLEEDFISKYKNEKWFNEAWEEYRQHVLTSSMDEVKMPGFIFNKYIKGDK